MLVKNKVSPTTEAINNLLPKIDNQKRIFCTNKKWNGFKEDFDILKCLWKPLGLWYALGNEWIDWCIGAGWGVGVYLYEVELNNDKIIHLKSNDELNDFSRTFSKNTETKGTKWTDRYNDVDWSKVSSKYDGIEIFPYIYHYEKSPLFYYGWDVASGCLWKKPAIKEVRLLAEYNSKRNKYLFG
jgi:hypothetical protein